MHAEDDDRPGGFRHIGNSARDVVAKATLAAITEQWQKVFFRNTGDIEAYWSSPLFCVATVHYTTQTFAIAQFNRERRTLESYAVYDMDSEQPTDDGKMQRLHGQFIERASAMIEELN